MAAVHLVPCPSCDGSGTIRKFAEQGRPCPSCDGLGTVERSGMPPEPLTLDRAMAEEPPRQMIEPGESRPRWRGH